MMELENVGEVDCGIIGHKIHKDGASVTISSEESIAFVLDAPKRRKKQKACPHCNLVNFFH